MPGVLTIRRTPLAALLQDEFRRGWWKLACAQIAAFGTAAIVYSSLKADGALDPPTGRNVHLVLVWILYAAAAGAALSAGGDPARLSLLPISNRLIAGFLLFPGMVCTGLIYLTTAVALNTCYGTDWPLWGPALFLPAVLGVMQSSSLAVGQNHVRRLVGWCLAGIFLEEWLCRRYGGSFLHPSRMWQHVTLAELVTLTLMIGGAWLVVTNEIARARRGDAAVFAVFSGRLSFRPRGPRRTMRPFRNQARAQFWFEWRQKGLILPGLFAVMTVLLLTGFFLQQFEKGTYELLHVNWGFGAGLCPIALIVGLALGHLDLAAGDSECGTFLATRPTTNAALSGAVLKASAASLLVTWGLWCVAMLGSTAVLYFDQGPEPVLDLWTVHGRFSGIRTTLGCAYVVMVFAIVLMAAWSSMSLAVSIALAGRKRLLIGIVAGGIPVFLLLLLLAERSAAGRGAGPAGVWHTVAGVAALAGTAGVWLAARRREQVSSGRLRAALAGWFALFAVGAGIYVLTGPLDLSHLVLLAGLLALPFAPWAAAPLALAWNRHR